MMHLYDDKGEGFIYDYLTREAVKNWLKEN